MPFLQKVRDRAPSFRGAPQARAGQSRAGPSVHEDHADLWGFCNILSFILDLPNAPFFLHIQHLHSTERDFWQPLVFSWGRSSWGGSKCINGGFVHLSAEGNLKRTSLNVLFQQIKQARIKGWAESTFPAFSPLLLLLLGRSRSCHHHRLRRIRCCHRVAWRTWFCAGFGQSSHSLSLLRWR